MALVNREKARIAEKKYRDSHPGQNALYQKNNPEKVKIWQQKYREKHRKEILERSRNWQKRNSEKVHRYRIEYNQKRRLTVLKYYSGGSLSCNCCGENILQFLSIDHIDGGGRKQSKEIRKGLYGWLIENNFPNGYQVLCHNCNMAKGFYGQCPHIVMTQLL